MGTSTIQFDSNLFISNDLWVLFFNWCWAASEGHGKEN